jgi:hypothetical protein
MSVHGQEKDQVFDAVAEHVKGLKIHAVISGELDADHQAALSVPLGQCSDEQLLAEVARRKLDIHANITQEMVKGSYDFDAKPLGHGASGEGTVYLGYILLCVNDRFRCPFSLQGDSQDKRRSVRLQNYSQRRQHE